MAMFRRNVTAPPRCGHDRPGWVRKGPDDSWVATNGSKMIFPDLSRIDPSDYGQGIDVIDVPDTWEPDVLSVYFSPKTL